MQTEPSFPFITGMGYRSKCNFIFDEFEQFNIDSIAQFDGMSIFVKTDFLQRFNEFVLPRINHKFILVTHNSDIGISQEWLSILQCPFLIKWLAQNVLFDHPLLVPIPIGIANKRWPHGNIEILKEVMAENRPKKNMFYCNFDVQTNPTERFRCLELAVFLGITISEKLPFKQYLQELSESYFVLSPNGNGIDCHKHWEALYLNAVPIVTKSINTIKLSKIFPMIVLDDWSIISWQKACLDKQSLIMSTNDIMKNYSLLNGIFNASPII
jgi:hypothetical protein